MEITSSLKSGELAGVAQRYQKPLTELFQGYWKWDKKKIELNAIASMLKDFKISPEVVLPKTVAEVYKVVGRGQALDYEGFVECLAKCAFKSEESSGNEAVEGRVFA